MVRRRRTGKKSGQRMGRGRGQLEEVEGGREEACWGCVENSLPGAYIAASKVANDLGPGIGDGILFFRVPTIFHQSRKSDREIDINYML